MKNLFLSSLLIAGFISCQSSPKHRFGTYEGRSVASGEVFSKFITTLASRSKTSQEALEQNILKFIKNNPEASNHGNHAMLGISKEQASQIDNLIQDKPFMGKVQKWVMENMTKIDNSLDKKMLASIYDEVLGESKVLANPYVSTATTSNANQLSKEISAFSSLSNKNTRIMEAVNKIDDRAAKKLYKKTLTEHTTRGKTNPEILANGQESVEAALKISRLTGKSGMGEGCESFSKLASSEVLEIKANIDIYRAKIIQDKAFQKNGGRSFASYDDIPAETRLTDAEIDEATVIAFKDVLGYTDDEAKAAISRLKNKPCRLY